MMRHAFVLVLLLQAVGARAETRCAAPTWGDSSLASIDAEQRLRFLREELRYSARRTRMWHWMWVAGYSGLTTYQLIYAGIDEERRNVNLVGAAGAAVGVLSLVISPRKIMRDQKWLERRIASAGPHTDPCALLADAERLLERDARDQAFGKGVLIHTGTIVFNIGLGLVMGLALGDWQQAMITSVVGELIGEMQIATQPVHAVSVLSRYRHADLTPVRGHGLTVIALPTASKNSIGFQIAAQF
jgi:hypothetical protein